MTETLFQILLALRDDASDADSILTRIEELGGDGRAPAIASFYRTLKRAVDEGFVDILDSSKAGRPGRPAQRYRITRRGRSALEREALRLRRLARLALTTSGNRESGS